MNRKDKTGMGVPTQCCRDSTEALEEQILRAVGNLREQPLLPAVQESHQPVPFVLWGVTQGTPKLSPRSPGSRSVPFPPTQEGQGVPGGKEGGLADLLFVV